MIKMIFFERKSSIFIRINLEKEFTDVLLLEVWFLLSYLGCVDESILIQIIIYKVPLFLLPVNS